MRKNTLLCLNDFIVKGLYGDCANKPFTTLFEKYLLKKFKNVNDFIEVVDAYVDFSIVNCGKIFESYQDLNKQEFANNLKEILLLTEILKHEDCFYETPNVDIVEYLINQKKNCLVYNDEVEDCCTNDYVGVIRFILIFNETMSKIEKRLNLDNQRYLNDKFGQTEDCEKFSA